MPLRWPVLLLLLLTLGCERAVPVSASGFGAFEPAATELGDSLAVAWYDDRHGSAEIYLRLLDSDLQPLTRELRLSTSSAQSYEVALAELNGALAVAWYDKNPAGDLLVQLGRWTAQGQPLWQQTLSSPSRNGRIPVLATVDTRLFVAWVEETRDQSRTNGADQLPAVEVARIVGAWLDAEGQLLAAPFEIAQASATTWNLNATALPDGRIALVFDADHATAASELYLALVDDSTATLAQLSTDDGFASKYPDLAVNGDRAALAWFDNSAGNDEVYLAMTAMDKLGSAATGMLEREARRITHTNGESIGAYLAWNGATLGLAWNDDDSGRHEIYFQSFDSVGQPLQSARRLTHTQAASMIPAVVPWGAGFALVWNEVLLAGGHDGGAGQTHSEIVARLVE